MVPQDAVAVVKSKNAEAVQAGLADFLDGLPVAKV